MANWVLMAGPLHRLLAALIAGALLAGCAGAPPKPEPPPGRDKGDAYRIADEWYYPLQRAEGYVERGKASWYGGKFHGRRTANGELYDMHRPTAAHRTLPLPTLVQVTNLENGQTTRVRVNDRGPFVDTHERIIDLSFAAAQRLGMDEQGVARVEVRAVAGPAELEAGKAGLGGEQAETAGEASEGHGGGDGEDELRPRPGQEELYLQVGAFRDKGNATRLKKRLRRTELGPVRVTTGKADSRPVYRVRMGPLESVLHADRLARQLRRQGIETGHIVRQ